MRNRINIVRVLGLVFVGAGLFLLSVSTPDLVYRIETAYRSIWYKGLAGVTITGVFLFSAGILGLLKSRFFIYVANLSLITGALLYSYFYLFELIPDLKDEPFWLPAIFGLIGYGIIVSFLMLINNEILQAAMQGQEETSRHLSDDILDSDLDEP